MIGDVRQLLLDAGSALETAGIAYAVIGGCARNAYAEPRAPYEAVQLPVVSPEDLIVYKLIAGRTQDFADVEVVIAALAMEQRVLDWAYIERWCADWDVTERVARVRPRAG